MSCIDAACGACFPRQALLAFHAASAHPDVGKKVGQFSRAGMETAACGNTMKSQNVAVKELLPVTKLRWNSRSDRGSNRSGRRYPRNNP